MQPGLGYATRLRVCNRVQDVQPGLGYATRCRVCNEVQVVQPGFGYAHGYMLKDSTYNLFKTVPS